MPRLPARFHLFGLIAAALIPVWLFAGYLLAQYALNARAGFNLEALQVARQVSLVVESELAKLQTVLEGLAKSSAMRRGDIAAVHAEAVTLAEGTDRIILMRDRERRQFFNTRRPYGSELPEASDLSAADIARMDQGLSVVSGVYKSRLTGEYRIAVAIPVDGPQGERWVLAITVPTERIREVMMPAIPVGWILGVGDRDGAYVARSQMHAEMTGKPGLPEYLKNIVGRSGTFTSTNFQNMTLLAGYYRSSYSDWFYAANIPLSTAQAPMWRSLTAVSGIGAVSMLISIGLAYLVGNAFAKATSALASRADALGARQDVEPLTTSVQEFATIGEALRRADRTLDERERELSVILETVPAAVWFTYDPDALQVIRNRFAAELMDMPIEGRKSFGTPDMVIDTVAYKGGEEVSRRDRPLSRAMRGEQTDNEEFIYFLPSGGKRTLLTSARPVRDASQRIIGAVQISLDISERKRGEEQRKLLVRELNHRVKNTLAVVQAIASQTLRNAGSLTEAQTALSSRLISLAKAHDILTHENWSGADLRELLNSTIASQVVLDRFLITGEPVRITPSLALALALGVHELTTNAIKYGALSNDGGTVLISWSTCRLDDRQRIKIEWIERGGPAVEPPRRKGFGTRMIERILDSELAGSVEFKFDRVGITCIFEADLPADAPDAAATTNPA